MMGGVDPTLRMMGVLGQYLLVCSWHDCLGWIETEYLQTT